MVDEATLRAHLESGMVLPNDIAALRDLLDTKDEIIARQAAHVSRLFERIERLDEQVAKLEKGNQENE